VYLPRYDKLVIADNTGFLMHCALPDIWFLLLISKRKNMTTSISSHRSNDSAKTLATVIYVLQATSFLVGITFVVAVIMNYLKRSAVAGTWVASHFRWQIRTFWYSLLWMCLGFMLVPFYGAGFLLLAVNGVWTMYRIIKGWLDLNDGKEMYHS
jgi:uncharacterized membrane protein